MLFHLPTLIVPNSGFQIELLQRARGTIFRITTHGYKQDIGNKVPETGRMGSKNSAPSIPSVQPVPGNFPVDAKRGEV